ncbi:ATP-binding cassette domain-containing protein [Egicoccus halophilus]|uniref:ABC transporter n=1 Tax=Egicoccus halophilus TaxID=1670830 RepID=A0A8J3AFR4_9ACTN|nr:ABC transporter ATP-binding protein [Egicoccus halophilus]GGI08226.1 ABC transporter [Egicoccus halophilus]
MNGLIEVEDLTVRFGDTVAVDGLSFRLEPGRIHGLLGRNGSGKTTLLSVLGAFRRPDAGRVTLDGVPVFERAEAVHRICFIRGHGDTVVNDWPDDRVVHALGFAAITRPGWDQPYAERLLDRFDVDPQARVGELSKGRRAALGITLGLASRAPVTLFDESYLGMDAPSRYAFHHALLEDFAETGRTFVLSTHHIEEVAPLLEEVLVIDRGRLLLQATTDDLREQGATVTGPAERVDAFVASHRVLDERRLGPTKAVTVFGTVSTEQRAAAVAAGLEIGPVPLQDLFVHLTEATKETR